MKTINLVLKLLFLVLFANTTYGQLVFPGGDTCAAPVPIPIGDGYSTPDDGAGEYDHWYSFVAPCDGELTVSSAVACGKRISEGICGPTIVEAGLTWDDVDPISHVMTAGEVVSITINDSWLGTAEFNIEFDDCEVDSSLLDVQGYVYYDVNDNGVKDLGEIGKYLNFVVSDPDGIFCVSGVDGHYYSPVSDLPDGTYEISPVLPEYWSVSSDSLVYTIIVDDDFEQRDSLDFGLYPDTLIYEVNAEFVGGYPRCNDTINYSLNFHNIGTTVGAGLVHLELDDSLYYVDADLAPDSIVGQNVYWNYMSLFPGEYELITVQVGTPDGLEDTVSSTFTVSVDSADVEMFVTTETLEQVITCAYDPNDKTPEPFGEGEFGYIDPETERIEYLIRFQNTGTDTAINVVIKDQLDENLDWSSLTPLAWSHYMTMEMDADGEVSFIFDNIMLPDSNVNEVASHGFVKYSIDLNPDLPLGTSIFNTAHIYFDLNPAVITNTTVNTLYVDDTGIDELTENQQILVYPNPFNESTTVYFGEDLADYSIQIVDMLGKQVYSNSDLNGNKFEIDARDFNEGMYILILVDKASNQVISNAKLIVN